MKIYVHYPRRRSVSSPVPNGTLTCDDRTMTVDTQNLPPKLVRLIPHAAAHAKPGEWKPFCALAIAMGLL